MLAEPYRRCVSHEEFYEQAASTHGLVFKNNDKGAVVRPLSLEQLLDTEFASNQYILENLFQEGELVLLAGERKASKSFFLADLLMAMASKGKFCDRIIANQKINCLLVDGELSLKVLQRRFRPMSQIHNGEDWAQRMRILSLKDEGKKINLLDRNDRLWIEERIDDDQVIAFDNYGKLVPTAKGSSPTAWREVEEWFEALRLQGKTVILVQHENKAGQLRGTLKMEDDADLLISLKRPKSWQPSDGNVVEVHFPAARHLHGEQLHPILVEYRQDDYGFHRHAQVMKEDTKRSAVEDSSEIAKDEVEKYGLSLLQVEILRIARATGEVRASNVKDDCVKGRSGKSVTAAFKRLCGLGLLVAQGSSTKGRFYSPA
nr:AAA family ATPase [uncultured Pseudodesulfovibrio sp.]